MTEGDPIPHLVELLERALHLAEDALRRREVLGEDTQHSPPRFAIAALGSRLEAATDGTLERGAPSPGLSRGAGDRVWLPEDEPLTRLLQEIDDYWEQRIWDHSPLPPSPFGLRIRHLQRGGR